MADLVTLENRRIQAKIAPGIGGSLYSLKRRINEEWIEVTRPTPESALNDADPGSFASFVMIPYSNRIANGLLRFAGCEHQLRINNADGHTIHGDVRSRPWTITEQTDRNLILQFNSAEFPDINWPFPFKSQLEHRVEGEALVISMAVKNKGDSRMPVGMGIHPYFRRALVPDDEVTLQVPIQGVYPGDSPIPNGPWQPAPAWMDFSSPRKLGREFIDNCFRSTGHQNVISWSQSGVSLLMDHDAVFQHVIVFCPENKDYFAVEPVTNANDGFNLAERGVEDTGTYVLEPDEVFSGSITLSIHHEIQQ